MLEPGGRPAGSKTLNDLFEQLSEYLQPKQPSLRVKLNFSDRSDNREQSIQTTV